MKITLVGAALSILLVGCLWFAFATVFPMLPTAGDANYLAKPEQITAVGFSLWNLRSLDLFILAIVLFVSVVGSMAMLGREEETA